VTSSWFSYPQWVWGNYWDDSQKGARRYSQ